MKQYLIYVESAPDPIYIECTEFEINYSFRKITFKDGNRNIAIFNFDNIIGFKNIENNPYIELRGENALLKREIDTLKARIKHLLQSNVIRLYDEKDPHTCDYKNDVLKFDEEYIKYKQAFDIMSLSTNCNECAKCNCEYSRFGEQVVYNCPFYVSKKVK